MRGGRLGRGRGRRQAIHQALLAWQLCRPPPPQHCIRRVHTEPGHNTLTELTCYECQYQDYSRKSPPVDGGMLDYLAKLLAEEKQLFLENTQQSFCISLLLSMLVVFKPAVIGS